MRESAGTELRPLRCVSVLSVSPIDEDAVVLERIVNDSGWTAHLDCKRRLIASRTLAVAVTILRQSHDPISIVVCERDLLPGSWIDVLEQLTILPDPPFLVVTSRLADERLWAEALNRGAYDVLAKPFDGTEVVHTLRSAWLHWCDHKPPWSPDYPQVDALPGLCAGWKQALPPRNLCNFMRSPGLPIRRCFG
jgi:CheY-like chemotaxis protein